MPHGMKKYFVLLTAMIFCSVTASAHKPVKPSANKQKTDSTKHAIICLSFEKIYDIDFHGNDYKIDFWCSLSYPKNEFFNFRDQIQVWEAKEITITTVDSSTEDNNTKLLLKINCKMFHKWDVKGYPFDGQKLVVIIYNAGKNISEFNFVTDGHELHTSKDPDLENGWKVFCADKVKVDSFKAPFGDTNYRSSVEFNLDIHRSNNFGLFSKIFVGMYVAFLVSFLALFINIKNYNEPRFGLMVGALFAAIANKYIVEGILPESPYFNLVDQLHALTFSAITASILFSVIALSNSRSKLLYWINRRLWLLLLTVYIALSTIFIIIAHRHQHSKESLSSDNKVEHQHTDQTQH